MKTPGQILYESQGSPVPYTELDERVRRQFELEGAAVWNAALDAAIELVNRGYEQQLSMIDANDSAEVATCMRAGAWCTKLAANNIHVLKVQP